MSAGLSNHESFLVILNDSIGRAALFDYLKSGYSEHHLTFWEEIEFHYKKDWSEGSVSHHNDAVARQLYERFIKNGAHAQINITEPQRVKLQKAIENIGTKDSNGNLQSATSDLFDEAASTCLELIKGNYFFPFQQSKQYQTYQNEKKQREDAKAKEEKKSNACCIL